MDRSTAFRGSAFQSLPLAAGVTVWQGTMVARRPSGWHGPAGGDPGELVVGVARNRADASGLGDGQIRALAEAGEFRFDIDPADPVLETGVSQPCYAASDRSVAGSDGGGERAMAGILTGIDSARGQAWVRIGLALAHPDSGAGRAVTVDDEGHEYASGDGIYWDAASARWSVRSFAAHVAAAAAALPLIGSFISSLVAKLASTFVKKADLQGYEDDFWSSGYDELLLEQGVGDKRYGWALASGDGSSAPLQSEVYATIAAAAPGKRTLIVGATQWGRIPNQATDWPPIPGHAVTSDDIAGLLNVHSVIPRLAEYPTFEDIGAPVAAGDGNGAYWYVPVTLGFQGSRASIPAAANGNVWKFSAHDPSDLDIDIPAHAVGNAPWVRPSGTEKTDATITTGDKVLLSNGDVIPIGEFVEWHDQHHVGETELPGYAFSTAAAVPGAGDVYVQIPFSDQGPDDANLFAIRPKSTDQLALLKQIILAGKRIRLWVSDSRYMQITSAGSLLEISGRLTGNFRVRSYALAGDALADGQAVRIKVHGNIPARSEIVDPAYADNSPNIAGAGGAAGKAWGWVSGATDAAWRRLLDILKADAGTAAKKASYRAALATGRLQKSVAGAGAKALNATEAAYDSVEFTGLKAGDVIVTLPAKPTGLRLIRNQSTGAFNLKLKAAGQADDAAVTLAAGRNVIAHYGGSLELVT